MTLLTLFADSEIPLNEWNHQAVSVNDNHDFSAVTPCLGGMNLAAHSPLMEDFRSIFHYALRFQDSLAPMTRSILKMTIAMPVADIAVFRESIRAELKLVSAMIEEIAADAETLKGVVSIREPLAVNDVMQGLLLMEEGMNACKNISLDEELRTRINGLTAMIEALPDNPVSGRLFIKEVFSVVDEIRQALNILDLMADPAGQYPLAAIADPEAPENYPAITGKWEIYIDGQPCRHRITGLSIEYDESYLHNEISITSADISLYNLCLPDAEKSARIELHIGGRILFFSIDDRKVSSERSFSISGFSPSVFADAEYNPGWSAPSLADPVSAKAYIEAIFPDHEIIWNLGDLDWLILPDQTFDGDAVEVLKKITDVVGAIARCTDEGKIEIRRKWNFTPTEMNAEKPVIRYERENIMGDNIQTEIIKGDGITAIEVSNLDADALDAPQMEIEESSPVQGQTVHIRVFWENDEPPDPVETYVTAGKIEFIGRNIQSFPEKSGEYERVEFKEGVASVPRPIYELQEVRWIGSYGGQISYERYTKELTIEKEWGIAEVRYTSAYYRYRLHTPMVSAILAVLGYAGEETSGISVQVKTEADPQVWADPVSDTMITSDAVAVERGKAEIYNRKYDRQTVSFTAPYNDLCVDGAIVHINDPLVSAVGNYRITRVGIGFNGAAITNDVGCERCVISE